MKFLEFVLQDVNKMYDCSSFFKTLGRYFYHFNFRVTIQWRILQYLERRKTYFSKKIFLFLRFIYIRRNEKYGIYLPVESNIKSGVFFTHGFPLVIHAKACIGFNCIIHPNAQIGTTRTKDGAPIIGDNCFLGNGCHIIGNCRIGNWCFISPGAFVCKDIPDGSVVGYGLNNIISSKGKETITHYLHTNM